MGVCGVGTSGVVQKVLHVPSGRHLVLKVRQPACLTHAQQQALSAAVLQVIQCDLRSEVTRKQVRSANATQSKCAKQVASSGFANSNS